MTHSNDRMPVIVGVGEVTDRPTNIEDARDPFALMVAAIRSAERDAGCPVVPFMDSLDIVNQVSWPVADPEGVLCGLLACKPRHVSYGPVGGETPIRFLHDAALRIHRGEARIAVVCGGEAEHSVRMAERTQHALPWLPRDISVTPPRSADFQSERARKLGLDRPVHVYPLYENATRVRWGQTFAEAQAESGCLWEINARTAATRPGAWLKTNFSATEIVTPSPDNRLVAWPYTKLMVANPVVNQAAALIMMSHAAAVECGVPRERMIHIWGGCASAEHDDLLQRPRYDTSTAQTRVLDHALRLLDEGGVTTFDAIELYSCFPVVTKMARRVLGTPLATPTTVAGGLTFHGAPLNNYMSHAAVAMVQMLRGAEQKGTGLLYGQGGYLTKHHSLVLGRSPTPSLLLDEHYRLPAPVSVGPPIVDEDYRGNCTVETGTVFFDQQNRPQRGVVIVSTPMGTRSIAAVLPRESSMARMMSRDDDLIGARGRLVMAEDHVPEFQFDRA